MPVITGFTDTPCHLEKLSNIENVSPDAAKCVRLNSRKFFATLFSIAIKVKNCYPIIFLYSFTDFIPPLLGVTTTCAIPPVLGGYTLG
jgi:hypothetical protein